MLSKALIEEVLEKALSTGGDFSEIFLEDTIQNNIKMVDGKIDSTVSGRNFGIGIRIFKGINCIYAYTNDAGRDSLIETAYKAACALGNINASNGLDINLTKSICSNIHPILYVPSSVDSLKKVKEIKKANATAKGFSNEISQVTINYVDIDQKVLIANSEGLLINDRRIRSKILVSSVASNGAENQIGTQNIGRQMGFEIFEGIDLGQAGKKASEIAVTMLHAPKCPSGKMPVVIEKGFGGVIFHEACGHALEATSVAKGNSIFAGKLGEKIASEKVTAIDDGTIINSWGSLNIDDEGMQTKKNILIEEGILKGYMIDKLNSRRMNMDTTGNARRESYKFAPTSRMTNTYIAVGNDEDKDIISSVDNGLYAKKIGGGSVRSVTGEFNFVVSEGYLIKDGKINSPVRGAVLIGKGSEVLMNIDMVGKKLDHGQGMCGSLSGTIPVNSGQPRIRVSELLVGGR